ncbi:11322_t:CDS:2, partial [Gigaspora margarita]
CLKSILCERFKVLKNAKPEDIEFFTFNDRINPLPPETNLNSLSESTTDIALLVFQYPLSTSTVIFHCNLSTSWFKSSFSHTSGIWYLVRNQTANRNEFQFNKIISKIKPNCEDECEVSISIQVANDLSGSNPSISEEAIAQLIAELKKKKSAFGIVNRNKSTCQEFISSLMSTAVIHVQEEAKELLLKAEEWIDRTKAYGPIDYSISIEEVLVLVQRVKKDDFEKGTAQNIAQIHSAIEYFFCWKGSSNDPTVELSGPHICEFNSNTMEQDQLHRLLKNNIHLPLHPLIKKILYSQKIEQEVNDNESGQRLAQLFSDAEIAKKLKLKLVLLKKPQSYAIIKASLPKVSESNLHKKTQRARNAYKLFVKTVDPIAEISRGITTNNQNLIKPSSSNDLSNTKISIPPVSDNSKTKASEKAKKVLLETEINTFPKKVSPENQVSVAFERVSLVTSNKTRPPISILSEEPKEKQKYVIKM